VLTFDYMETPLRADIVICVPVVRSEARSQGKDFRDHLRASGGTRSAAMRKAMTRT